MFAVSVKAFTHTQEARGPNWPDAQARSAVIGTRPAMDHEAWALRFGVGLTPVRTLKLLDCSPISCFNFDMEILSFGINRAPGGEKSPDYVVYLPINLQPPTSLATIVNAVPRS